MGDRKGVSAGDDAVVYWVSVWFIIRVGCGYDEEKKEREEDVPLNGIW